MHELSLALDLIDLATREADKNGISSIQKIAIEIGDICGVEPDTFKSALEILVKDTILENAVVTFIHTPGKGKCNACDREFEMKHRLDSCPECKSLASEISGGQEFRLISFAGE